MHEDPSEQEVEAAVDATEAKIAAALDGMSVEAVRALVSEIENAEACSKEQQFQASNISKGPGTKICLHP